MQNKILKILAAIAVLFIILAGVWLYLMANPPRVRLWRKIETGLKKDNPDWHPPYKVDWMEYKPVEMRKDEFFHLELYGPGLRNLKSLQRLNITSLSLKDLDVDNLDFLPDLPGLTYAHINSKPLKDISALAGKPLTGIFIASQNLSDISPLAELPNLASVGISSDQLKDVSALAGKPLTRVFLTSKSLSDISPLAEAPLKILSLRTENLESLDLLASFRDLIRLEIHGVENLIDLSLLRQMTSLKALVLEDTGVSLDNLEAIAHLELDYLRLTGDPSRQNEIAAQVKAKKVIITAPKTKK